MSTSSPAGMANEGPLPAMRPHKVTAKDIDCQVCGARGVPDREPCRGSAYSGRSGRNVQSHYARVQAAKQATDA